jgi:hypothetical protein
MAVRPKGSRNGVLTIFSPQIKGVPMTYPKDSAKSISSSARIRRTQKQGGEGFSFTCRNAKTSGSRPRFASDA